MYTALKMADKKYSVAVLEKKGRLGGHAQTYRAEPWETVYDLGVRIFPESDNIKEVFNRFDQKLMRASILDLKRRYVDFETGALSNYEEPSYHSTLTSLLYYWYYSGYTFSFMFKPGTHLPDPVPEDLLLTLGEFLKKKKIDIGFTPLIHYLQGYGAIENVPMLYVLKNITHRVASSIIWDSFYTPAEGVDAIYPAIYPAISKEIVKLTGKKAVYLNTEVQKVRRVSGKDVIVETYQDERKLDFSCKYLLVSAPPLLETFGSVFDFDDQERLLLIKAASFPGIYAMLPMPFPDHYNVLFGAEDLSLSDDDVGSV